MAKFDQYPQITNLSEEDKFLLHTEEGTKKAKISDIISFISSESHPSVRIFEEPIYPTAQNIVTDSTLSITVPANTKNIFNVQTGGSITIVDKTGEEFTDVDDKTFVLQFPFLISNVIFLDENNKVLPEVGYVNHMFTRETNGLNIHFFGMWNADSEDAQIRGVFARLYYLGIETGLVSS